MPSEKTALKYEEFLTMFSRQIFSLDYVKQLSFAIIICKKLFFDYVEFSEKYHWGNKDILLDSIATLEKAKKTDIKIARIEQMLSRLDIITPDTDDFDGDELASYALNACVAVSNTIQFIKDKLPKLIYEVGICFTDTIYFKIQELQSLSDSEIDNNPLMIEARQFLLEKSK